MKIECVLCLELADVVLHVEGIGQVCLNCCHLAVKRHVEALKGEA